MQTSIPDVPSNTPLCKIVNLTHVVARTCTRTHADTQTYTQKTNAETPLEYARTIKQGRLHGYSSRVRVGRGSDKKGKSNIRAEAVMQKTARKCHKKKIVINRLANVQTDQCTGQQRGGFRAACPRLKRYGTSCILSSSRHLCKQMCSWWELTIGQKLLDFNVWNITMRDERKKEHFEWRWETR